jgi:hypothetical protein
MGANRNFKGPFYTLGYSSHGLKRGGTRDLDSSPGGPLAAGGAINLVGFGRATRSFFEQALL